MNLQDYAKEVMEKFEDGSVNDSVGLNEVNSLDHHLQQKIDSAPLELKNSLKRAYYGYGPISELVDSTQVTEIIVSRNTIWVERDGKLKQHEEGFLTDFAFKRFIELLIDEAGVKFDMSNPIANGKWNRFRMHLIAKPLSHENIVITLRRQTDSGWVLEDLKDRGMLADYQTHALSELVEQKKSILIVGTTGSGKTTLVNALLKRVPEEERLIILEDTDELHCPHANTVKLLTREADSHHLRNFSLESLLKESLRMRPDRLVVGEVRGQEAKDLLLTLSTGHSGFMGTLHAKSAREALWRLEMLVQMGAPQWNQKTIRQLIYHALDGVIVVSKTEGKRTISEFMRIAGLEENGLLLEPFADPYAFMSK